MTRNSYLQKFKKRSPTPVLLCLRIPHVVRSQVSVYGEIGPEISNGLLRHPDNASAGCHHRLVSGQGSAPAAAQLVAGWRQALEVSRDFTAFFLASSIMCFLSLSSKKYEYIFCCGLIYLFAGTFNILASISHDAPLGLSSLIAEIVFALMAFTAAFRYKNTL